MVSTLVPSPNTFLSLLATELFANQPFLLALQGISLSLQQYETFIKAIPEINAQLHKMGHDVEDSEDAGGVSTSGGAIPKPVKKSTSEARAKKANIEATSDEEEDDDDD